MKKSIFILFLIALLIIGLNGVAAGMHRLLPSAPSCVVGIDWDGRSIELNILEKKLLFGQ